MKLKNFFIAALAAAFVLVGCEPEDNGGAGGKIQKPVTKISQITQGSSSNALGVVMAAAKNYYVISDGTGNIGVYSQEAKLKIGDKVLVEGMVKRGKDDKYTTDALQFASPTCTVISSDNTLEYSPVAYDGPMIEAALGGDCTLPEVTFKGRFYKNGTYYNLNIKGTSKQAGFYYQEEGSWDDWNGKNVIVKAYLIQQYNYFNVIPYDVVEDPNPVPFVTSLSTDKLEFPATGASKTLTVNITTETGWVLTATSNNPGFTSSVEGNVVTVTAAEATAAVNAELTVNLTVNGEVVDSYTVDLAQSAPLAEGQQEVVLDYSAMEYENGTAVSEIKEGGLTLTFSAGDNKNGPKYYTTGTAIRLYGGNSVTIAGGTIASVVFTFSSGEGTNAIVASAGTYNKDTGTWTGSASPLTFTIDGTSGHRRVKKMVIIYTPSAE